MADSVLTVGGSVFVRGDHALRIGRHTGGLVVTGLAPGAATTRLAGAFGVVSLASTKVDAFVGHRGAAASSPFTATGVQDGAVGLFARDVNFGYAVFTDGRHVFDSLALDVPAAGLVGTSTVVKGDLHDVRVGRNGGLRLLDLRTAAIDFPRSFPATGGFELRTPGGGAVTLDRSDAVQAVSAEIGAATLGIDGFVELSGAFALEVGGRIGGATADAGIFKAIPAVAGTLTHDLYTMKFGGRNLRGFAGATVPAVPGFAGFDSPRRIGTEIEDVTFGLAIMPATSVSGFSVPGIAAVLPTYVAAEATVGRAREVGFDSYLTRLSTASLGRLVPSIEGVSIAINTSFVPVAASIPALQAVAGAALPMPALDLRGAAFDGGGPGLEIATGDAARPIVLDERAEVIEVDVEYFDATMFGFFDVSAGGELVPRAGVGGVDLVGLGILAGAAAMPVAPPSLQVAGSLTLAKRGNETVTLTDGREIQVTSLGFVMNDVRGFMGAGQYWDRNPVTGRIDGSSVDSRAVGFVIDDLDIGAAFMLRAPRATSPLPAVYVGGTARLGSARLVGTGDLANAKLTNFELHVNLAASADATAIDFGRSTHVVVDAAGNPVLDAAGNPVTAAGYAVAGTRGDRAVVLAHRKALLETQGSIDAGLLGLASLTGDFRFAGSASNILLFVQGAARVGPAGAPFIDSRVEAFLRVDSAGVVSRFTLDTDSISLGGLAAIEPERLSLLVNTTGRDATFEIPVELRRPGGAEAITVSAIPPGGSAPAGYVAASGGGRIRLTDAVTLEGRFDMVLKLDVSTLVVDATLDLPVLAPLDVAGRFTFTTGAGGGLFGSLTAQPRAGGSMIDAAGFRLGAAMLLEVNTSPVERQVRSLKRDGEDDPDGDGYVMRGVPASTTRLAGLGSLEAGGAAFVGAVGLTFEPGRVRARVASTVNVGAAFGRLNVTGDAWILHGAGRETALVFEGRASGNLLGGVSGVDGAVLVNTGSTDVRLDSGTVVRAKTDFDVRLAARLDVGLFAFNVGGRLFRQGDVWELRVEPSKLDFFGAATLDVSGFYRSTGAYLLDATGRIGLDAGVIVGTGSIIMSLGRDTRGTMTFRGEILGTTRYDLGFLGSGAGPGFRGTLAFGPSSVSFGMQVGPILGSMRQLGPFTWKRKDTGGTDRPTPVIARLADGVLTLAAGDAPDRYGPGTADWYGSVLNESFRIDAVRDGSGRPVPGTVIVRSLGVEQTFSGVTTIVADGGDGSDTFEAGPGVDAVLRFDGGPGSDTFIVSDLVPGSRFAGGGSGAGYDTLELGGLRSEHLLSSAGATMLIARGTAPAATATAVGIDAIRFRDATVAVAAQPLDTRAMAGPIVNGSVHLDLRTYADGKLVTNLDITPENGEPATTTDARGVFEFPDSLLAGYDRDGDGTVDYRDGLVVVGTFSDNGEGTTISVIDSITGADLGIPLVGLPGHDASLVSTIKYATLLRWRPDQKIAGRPVTPELINGVLARILADAPSTFTDESFSPYVALSSSDPAEVAKAVETLRFAYTHLGNVLTVRALLTDLGLDFSREAAWGYRPDPTRADRVEVISFSAYLNAIATRFGERPLDVLGRPPVAAQFDPTNEVHVRAVFKEMLTNYPTKSLLEREPGVVADFVSDPAGVGAAFPTLEQQSRVEAAVERQFGTLLDNIAKGLVLTQKALIRRVVDSAALSELAPALGTQLLVPSVAGLKRLFIEELADGLVALGKRSPEAFQAAYNPLFYQPKPVEKATQPTTGLIGLSVAGGSVAGASHVTLGPGDGLVRLQLDYRDARGPVLAPDYGLAVRYRLGGTAREGIDYTIVGNGGMPIASIPAGESTGTLALKVAADALAAGDRFIQVELLSADSGMRVEAGQAVVTIALGTGALPAGAAPTGDRAAFVPHTLVTAAGPGPAVIRAPAGGRDVVLRGEPGRADLFVVGDAQGAGIPFVENFRAEDGDRIWIAAGDLMANRRARQLADPTARTAALAAMRERYGAGTVAALPTGLLEDLVAAEIEAAAPLAPFAITELNTYGGFVFDVTGRRAVAMVSDYSTTTGDTAWASLSMNPAAGTALATAIRLSATVLPENAPAGTRVGELSAGGLAGPASAIAFALVPGAGGDDNGLFEVVRDDAGPGPRWFLAARGPLDHERDPWLSVRVRSTDAGGNAFEQPFAIRVTDVNELAAAPVLSGSRVVENCPIGTLVGTLSTADPDLGDRVTFSLVAGPGGADNASFTIVGNELRTAAGIDFEKGPTRSVRVWAADGRGGGQAAVFTVAVTNVKEAPAISLPAAGFRVVEDTAGPLRFTTAPFGTTDAPAAKRVTVTLSVPRGEIVAAANGGVVVGGTPRAATFTGTIGDLNRYFTDRSGRIVYRPQANDAAPVAVEASVVEQTAKGPMRSAATGTITIVAVNDLPVVRAPAAFSVVEDVPGPISWAAVGVPFADVDAARLTVTLSVPDGAIHAAGGAGVAVGGTGTARTFSGSPGALNAFFRSLGRITYTTARDNTAARLLRTTVSDGEAVVSTTSVIGITPVDDAPTLAASGVLAGAVAGVPFRITHASLLAASAARDAEGAPLTFRLTAVHAGRIERWDGLRWRTVTVGGTQGASVWLEPAIRAGDVIRWVPPPSASGTVAAFTIRVDDGKLTSAGSCKISMRIGRS